MAIGGFFTKLGGKLTNDALEQGAAKIIGQAPIDAARLGGSWEQKWSGLKTITPPIAMAVGAGYGVAGIASGLDRYNAANSNLTNEDYRNRALEQNIGYGAGALGVSYGAGGLAAGAAIGTGAMALAGKLNKTGFIGVAIGGLIGLGVGRSYGSFQEKAIRSAFRNDYLNNEGESDVEGARTPYHKPDYTKGALTAAAFVGGGYVAVKAAGMYASKLPTAGFMGALSAPVRFAGNNQALTIGASTLAGIGIGTALARRHSTIDPQGSRIRGLGY